MKNIRESSKKKKNKIKRFYASILEKLNSYTEKQGLVFNLIMGMKNRYLNVVITQSWVSRQLGIARCTVNRTIKQMQKDRILIKYGRGWRFVHPGAKSVTKNQYIKKPCEYFAGIKLKQALNSAQKNLEPNHPLMVALTTKFPSIKRYILSIATVLFLMTFNLYNKEDIKYKDMEQKQSLVQNISQSSKSSQNKDNFHTRTPSVSGNAPHCKTEGNHKRGCIDLRCCTETLYSILGDEDKKIASRYHSGVKKHGSIHAYEQHLHKCNMSDKIWIPTFDTSIISPYQQEIIRSFPESIVQSAREEFRQKPMSRNNFNWVYDYCIRLCIMKNIPISELLKKYGYCHKEYNPKPVYKIKQKSYPYKMFVDRYDQEELRRSPIPVDKINPKFRELVGENVFESLCSNYGSKHDE